MVLPPHGAWVTEASSKQDCLFSLLVSQACKVINISIYRGFFHRKIPTFHYRIMDFREYEFIASLLLTSLASATPTGNGRRRKAPIVEVRVKRQTVR